MQQTTIFIEPLIQQAEEFGRTSIELIKLKAIRQSAKILSNTMLQSIAILTFAFSFLFATLGLALWLGDVLGKAYYGFLSVAGFYLLVGCIVRFLMHNYIKKRITNSLITQFLN